MTPNLQQINHLIVCAGGAVGALQGAAKALTDLEFPKTAETILRAAADLEQAIADLTVEVVAQDEPATP